MIPVEVIAFGISLPLVAIALITRKNIMMRRSAFLYHTLNISGISPILLVDALKDQG